MKVLDSKAGHISNSELLTVLNEQLSGPNEDHLRASEVAVRDYLVEVKTSSVSRDELQALIEAVRPFDLTNAEVVQLINLRPSAPVEIHLVVEDCEERLAPEQVEQLIQLVQLHLAA